VTPPVQTSPAGVAEARRFLAKAEGFLRAAKREHGAGEANPAGAMAIHAGISACDALTSFFLGVRSKGGRHHDVLELVASLPVPEKNTIARQLRQLLDAKNTVEYDDRTLIAGDEDKMIEAAERIVKTARAAVK
jgi:HEPN domain-containing protein